MPKLLIVVGVVLILAGLIWLVGERFGLGRLPGDIFVERGNFRFYFPITTSLINNAALSIIFLDVEPLIAQRPTVPAPHIFAAIFRDLMSPTYK
jgi:hypothetical protein